MNSSQDSLFGVHATALSLWTRRNDIIASNIANADTPNYKARDLDFQAVLGTVETLPLKMSTTTRSHQGGFVNESAFLRTDEAGMPELKYRVPLQPALDGNTVESDIEQAKFGENAMRYQVSLRFLSGTVSKLKAAIAGAHQ